MKKKGFFTFILTFVMLLILPQCDFLQSVVYAADANDEEVTIVIESEAEDMGNLQWISEEEFAEYKQLSLDQISEEFKNQTKKRVSEFVIKYASKVPLSSDELSFIHKNAVKHTGVSDEGDYLRESFTHLKIESVPVAAYFGGDWAEYDQSEVYYCFNIEVSMEYNSTEAEEKAVTEKLQQVYKELGLSSKTDEEKIKLIHDYIVKNVEYDNDSLINKDPIGDYSSHSAYFALIEGQAVCSGYAQLFYRMALDNGIDCRITEGISVQRNGDSGRHAWNLVELGDKYYYIDTTWNDGGIYKYYLYGSETHAADHIPDSDIISTYKAAGYPISSSDYIVEDRSVPDTPKQAVVYRTHVEKIGWQNFVRNGSLSGTVGESKRLEGIEIKLENAAYSGGIEYRTHVQSIGWQDWRANGKMSGTSGQAKRLEAIQIRLTGEMANHYSVFYRVQAQTYGWLGWSSDGGLAGTAGYAKRLEAIQIVLVEKGKTVTGNTVIDGVTLDKLGKITSATKQTLGASYVEKPKSPDVIYRTHIQSIGWQGFMANGAMSGTSGQAKRLEGIEIKLQNCPYSGGIRYTTHIQSYGWQGSESDPNTWKKDGAMSGTIGSAKRLEAIRIILYGEMAKHYDVYYRVHAQSYGWLGWAKNGEAAGTAGYSKRLEGIQIVLVAKGASAPARAYKNISSARTDSYIRYSQPVSQTGGKTVYISQTGSKYHYSSTCSNMRSTTAMSIERAKSLGYQPCSKCAH